MFFRKNQPTKEDPELSHARTKVWYRKEACPDPEARILAATRDYPDFAALLAALNTVDSVRVLPYDCTLPRVRRDQAPRIRFEASLGFARELRKEVLADGRREQPVLRAPWDVLVVSEDALRVVFELSCADYLEVAGDSVSYRHCALLGLFKPENLAHDFAALTEMVTVVREHFTPQSKK